MATLLTSAAALLALASGGPQGSGLDVSDLEITVIGEDGEPVAGAEVFHVGWDKWLTFHLMPTASLEDVLRGDAPPLRTDDQGRVRLPGGDRAGVYYASHDQHGGMLTVDEAEVADALIIALRPTPRIPVQVVDSAGDPVASVQLTLHASKADEVVVHFRLLGAGGKTTS